jgi:hypothetical protein
MTAPTVDAPSWDAFLRVLSTRAVGTPISSNALRDDLDAAQVPPSSRGGCFQKAIDAGYITTSGMSVRSTGPRSRGSRRLVYVLMKRPTVAVDRAGVS